MRDIFIRLQEWGCDVENSLVRFVKDEEFYLKYICEFKNEKGMEQLGKCLLEEKNTEAFEYAHMLKGVSGNLGLIPIYNMTTEMVEILRKSEDGEKIENACTLYTKLMEQFHIFCSLV